MHMQITIDKYIKSWRYPYACCLRYRLDGTVATVNAKICLPLHLVHCLFVAMATETTTSTLLYVLLSKIPWQPRLSRLTSMMLGKSLHMHDFQNTRLHAALIHAMRMRGNVAYSVMLRYTFPTCHACAWAWVSAAWSRFSFKPIFLQFRVWGGVTQNASSPTVMIQISWCLNTMFYINVCLKDVQG